MPHVRASATLWRRMNARRNFERPPMGGVAMPIAFSFQEMIALSDGDRRTADLIDYQEALYMQDERTDRNREARRLAMSKRFGRAG